MGTSHRPSGSAARPHANQVRTLMMTLLLSPTCQRGVSKQDLLAYAGGGGIAGHCLRQLERRRKVVCVDGLYRRA